MFYVIKNISSEDIPIGHGILKSGKSMITFNLQSINEWINNGCVTVQKFNESNNDNHNVNNIDLTHTNQVESSFIKNYLYENLIESFFKFYFNQDMQSDDLQIIKWFYKNIGFTSKIKHETLKLIDDVQSKEELIEVLLNNVYPELLELYLSNQKINNVK